MALRALLTNLVLEPLDDGTLNEKVGRYSLSRGRVLSIGPGPYERSGILYTPDVRVGDVVVYQCGDPIECDGRELVSVGIEYVAAVDEPEPEIDGTSQFRNI